METKPPYLLAKPFFGTYGDAIHFALLAQQLPETDQFMLSYIHSSMLASALALEGLANILLKEVKAPRCLIDRFDRFTALEKITLFVWASRAPTPLNHGDTLCQQVSELFKLRDKFVHTRVATHPAERTETGPGRDMNFKETDKSVTPLLKIPNSPFLRNPEHAVTVLRLVDAFTEHLLIGICKMDAETSSRLLCDMLVVDDRNTIVSLGNGHIDDIKKGKEQFGLKLPILNEKLLKR